LKSSNDILINCKICLKEKAPAKSGKKPDGSHRFRRVCKACHSNRVNHDQKQALINNKPSDFIQCDSCCKIWQKRLTASRCNCTDDNLFDGLGEKYRFIDEKFRPVLNSF